MGTKNFAFVFHHTPTAEKWNGKKPERERESERGKRKRRENFNDKRIFHVIVINMWNQKYEYSEANIIFVVVVVVETSRNWILYYIVCAMRTQWRRLQTLTRKNGNNNENVTLHERWWIKYARLSQPNRPCVEVSQSVCVCVWVCLKRNMLAHSFPSFARTLSNTQCIWNWIKIAFCSAIIFVCYISISITIFCCCYDRNIRFNTMLAFIHSVIH